MDLPFKFQTIALLLALVFLYKALTGSKKSKGKQALPEPAGALPIIGHLYLLGKEPLVRRVATFADKYGPIFMFRIGMRPTLIISSSDLMKECLTTNDKALSGRPTIEAATNLTYNNAMFAFAPYGPYWREMRKIATLELLSSRRLESFKHIRSQESDLFMRSLYGHWEKNPNSPIDMRNVFGDLTFNIVTRIVVGKRFFGASGEKDSGEDRRFRDSVFKWFKLFGAVIPSDFFPFLKWVDIFGYKKQMKETLKELDSILSTWLVEHHQRRKGGDTKREQDFMDILISVIKDAEFDNFDADTVIKAMSLTGILGGFDVSITLSWALSLLVNNPDTLKKAQEEVDLHVGKERKVEESDVRKLVYLHSILKETLRLRPSFPLNVPHKATEDLTIGGYDVPAGTLVLFNLWKMHRDPRIWKDPEVFRPDRFLNDNAGIDLKGQHYELIPFGAGRRMCPGTTMALQIVHLAMARFLQGFDIVTPSGNPVDMTMSRNLTGAKPTPVEVLLKPRLPSSLY